MNVISINLEVISAERPGSFALWLLNIQLGPEPESVKDDTQTQLAETCNMSQKNIDQIVEASHVTYCPSVANYVVCISTSHTSVAWSSFDYCHWCPAGVWQHDRDSGSSWHGDFVWQSTVGTQMYFKFLLWLCHEKRCTMVFHGDGRSRDQCWCWNYPGSTVYCMV